MFARRSIRQIVLHPSWMLTGSAVLLVSLLPIAICGCCLLDVGLAYKDDMVADYAVWATDALEDAAIVRKTSESSGTHIVGPMVFAYGWNNDFILAKQHPMRKWPKVDTGTTNWFIIEVRTAKVHGPLTEEEFLKVRQAIGVPSGLTFTKYVEEKKY